MSKKAASEDTIAQFCSVTGASVKDARRFLDKYKRVDAAVDAYYNDPDAGAAPPAPAARAPSTSRLNALFDTYKDPDTDEITVDGTLRLCADLAVDPEDVALLALARELRSPRVGEWARAGWLAGWKAAGADTLPAMQAALARLRARLGAEPAYFAAVYAHTFDFARVEGQRSVATDTAIAFWGLLLPHGLRGGALAAPGWDAERTAWWFEFLAARGGKGVSRDTWLMFLDFVRTIDAQFATYDLEAAWPSAIDDFVEWARARIAAGA